MDMSTREASPAAPTQSGVSAAPKASTPDSGVARSFAILLGFQCLGELIVYVTRAPVPGPVLGMVLLLCLLSAKPSVVPAVEQVSRGLLNHLSLFFVPAGVGVMVFAPQLKSQLFALALAIVVSTILSMAIAALVTGMLLTRLDRKQSQHKAATAPRG
ncbi:MULTISPECIES: CidA/LrgA family protein [Paraburkholderia]|uniref:CidA/LrgA family protein n=1 Tax=Paraburkholderia TaxID=1822464 RepID=UPI00159223D0|nr:CidA/LrgA family protein [Paraburkholderia youngii]NUX52712.1 CidA/LrgA family protein [Paraburkholderia youngii]